MYRFVFSETFYEDLDSAYEYISDEFDVSIARKNLFSSLDKKLSKMEIMPYAWSLIRDHYLASNGYRSVLVKNYLMFFAINEDEKTIEVKRFLHSSRDWKNILNENFLEE